jgi:predicted nucleic acid-binding Zn ribbon protein
MLRLFDFQCSECGITKEFLIEQSEIPKCPYCSGGMKKLFPNFKVVMGPVGSHGYYDETLGKYINTNIERRVEMAKQGVTEKGATPKQGQVWV